MKQPRITIITPNFNNGEFLERTICSVLDQGYKNLEYFVIDGGSADNSLDILQRYENDLAGWVSEPDTGASHAINKGLARATGEIVGILRSDDLYLPGALRSAARRLGGRAKASWLVGQCLRIGAGDEMLGRLIPSEPDSFSSFLMHNSGLFPAPATFWRRGVVESLGRLDPELEEAFDYEYCCRLIAAGEEVILTDETLAARREHVLNRGPAQTLRRGMEYITTARRYADRLPMTQRYPLWLNCDQRERIHILAQAEMQGENTREFLWQQLLRHPWWVVDQTLRHRLVHGIAHPVPHDMLRPAA